MAEAHTQAKQSTETLPLVINVPTVLEYDMSHNSQWRSWFHNQAPFAIASRRSPTNRPRLHLSGAKSGAIRSET
jgi:hypothetical protein